MAETTIFEPLCTTIDEVIVNKEFWAGVFVLIGMGVGLGVYTTLIVDTTTQEYSIYRLDAANVSGIEVGTPILMAGYGVGKVTNIEVLYKPSLRFEVTMSLKPEVPIPLGVIPQMGTRLAGGGLINLVPPERITGFLESNARLTLEPSTDIQSLLDSADSILKDLAVMTKRGREFVEDPKQGLELRLKEVDMILSQVNELLRELTQLTRTSEGMLLDSAPLVQQSLSNAETLSADSIDLMGQMGESLKEFDAQVSTLGTLMNSYDPGTNTEVNAIFESLEQSTSSLTRLMHSIEKRPLRTLRKGVEEQE
jgi:ABC-type transporter Mla subunit MlaD